jgi:hypothetical protein
MNELNNTESDPGKRPEVKETPEAAELNENQLDQVAGGFNPQPDPPGRS